MGEGRGASDRGTVSGSSWRRRDETCKSTCIVFLKSLCRWPGKGSREAELTVRIVLQEQVGAGMDSDLTQILTGTRESIIVARKKRGEEAHGQR